MNIGRRISILRVRRLHLLLATAVVALAIPAVAGAWAQYYAALQVFQPGGVETSGSNYELTENETYFARRRPNDAMLLNLCPSSGACYGYLFCYATCNDPRNISYGYAKCTAWSGNEAAIDVNYCWTKNIY